MNSMEGIGCELAGALGLERVDSQHPFCLLLIRITKRTVGYLGGSSLIAGNQKARAITLE